MDDGQDLGGGRQIERPVLGAARAKSVILPDLRAGLVDDKLILNLASRGAGDFDGANVEVGIGAARRQDGARPPAVKGTVDFDRVTGARVEGPHGGLNL